MDEKEKLNDPVPDASSEDLTDLISKAIEKKKTNTADTSADDIDVSPEEDVTSGEVSADDPADEEVYESTETPEEVYDYDTSDDAEQVEDDPGSDGDLYEYSVSEEITYGEGDEVYEEGSHYDDTVYVDDADDDYGYEVSEEMTYDDTATEPYEEIPAEAEFDDIPADEITRPLPRRDMFDLSAMKDLKKEDTKPVAPRSKKKPAAKPAAKTSAKSDTAAKNTKKKKSSKKKKAMLTLEIMALTLLVVAGLGAGVFFYYAHLLNRDGDRKINDSAAPVNEKDIYDEPDTFNQKDEDQKLIAELQKSAKRISNENVMNILLIGEDIRDTEVEERANTDVMMIISINRENHTITLTSLMRDMYVYMEKFDVSGKLNSAYWHDGSDYLAEVIEDYFRIDIDRYVKVNFRQFIDIVETVGGLDVDVSYNEAYAMMEPLNEQNKYLGYDWGTDYVDLEQYGMNPWEYAYGDENEPTAHLHLNGNQALAYARIRYGCGDDYARTQRQREVITLIIDKSKSLSLTKLDGLIKQIFPEVETDIDDGEIASLLLNTSEYLTYDIQQLRIPVEGYYTDDFIWSQQVLRPDYQANAAIMRNMIYGSQETVERAAAQYENELADGTFYEKNGIEPPFEQNYQY